MLNIIGYCFTCLFCNNPLDPFGTAAIKNSGRNKALVFNLFITNGNNSLFKMG